MKPRYILLDILLGFILPLVIASSVMWRLFITPGTIFHGDLMIIFDVHFTLNEINYAWIPRTSGSQAFQAIPWPLLLSIPKLIGFSDDIAIKMWISLSYALSSLFIYSTLRLLLPAQNKNSHYIACTTGLAVYMLNQVVISELIVPNMLLSYSALPLFSILFIKLIQQKSYGSTVKYLVGTALITTFLSIYPPVLFFAAVFVILYLIYRTLKYRASFIGRDSGKTALSLCISFLINSYWIIPLIYTILHSPETASSIYVQSPFSIRELYTTWNAEHGWNTINTLGLIGGFGWPYNQQPPNIISASLSLVLPILASFPMLLLKRFDKYTRRYLIFHVIAFLFFTAFANRDRPFIDLVALLSYLIWYSGLPLRGQLWTLIKQPNIFLLVIPYFYSFLVGSLIIIAFSGFEAHLRGIRMSGKILLVAIILSLTILAAWPFSGDVYGRFRPAQIPQEYYELNSYFEKSEGLYRGWWLPIDYGFVYYRWSGYYPNSHPFFTNKPWILWKSDLANYLYIYGILNGGTDKIGSILSSLGVKYVILRTDVNPQPQIGYWDELSRALSGLQRQKDLKLVFHDGYLYVFEVSEEPRYVSISKLALVFGGFKVPMTLHESEIVNITNYTFVLAEQLSGEQLMNFMKYSNLIVLGPHNDIEELSLQLLDKDFIYPSGSPNWSSISGSAFYPYYLNPLSVKNNLLIDWSGDMAYGNVLTTTSNEGASLEIPISINSSGEYEIWFRVLKSPLSGLITINLQGRLYNVSTMANDAYLDWIKIADVKFKRGRYHMLVTNSKGLNAINAILVEPKVKIEETVSNVYSMIKGKTIIKVDKEFYKIPLLADQQAWPSEFISGIKPMGLDWIADGRYVAQIFVPNRPEIHAVELWLARYNPTANLLVELVPVINGMPEINRVLAKAEVPPQRMGYVASGPVKVNLVYENLTVGKPYAIVLKQKNDSGTKWGEGDAIYFAYFTWNLDAYPHGYPSISDDQGKSWHKWHSEGDLLFKIYVPGNTERTYNLLESQFSKTVIYIWNASINEFSILNNPLYEEEERMSLNFELCYPGMYHVVINASKPFVLALSERYDPLWQVNIKDTIHLPLLSTMNGYYVNKTGEFEMVIEYAMNAPFELGKRLSLLSIIGMTILLALLELKPLDKWREYR